MNKSLVLPAALAGQLIVGSAFAQSAHPNVTVLRMSGPQLGVRLQEVDGDAVSRLKLKEEKGALVVDVMENSAAEKAGIKRDDVILKFQGESVLTAAQLSRLVKDVPSGRKVDLDIVREGAPIKLTATLQKGELNGRMGELPDVDMPMLPENFAPKGAFKFRGQGELPRTFNFNMDENGPAWKALTQSGRGRLGITYTEIEGQLATYFKAPKENAVLVNSVSEGSAAYKAGLKAGDVIIKVGSTSVEDASDLRDAVNDLEGGRATAITVIRDGRSVDLSVTVEDQRKAKMEGSRFRKPVS
ncbi:MAG: PDZ domain-containing protein [Vicinamibacteria bacterium]